MALYLWENDHQTPFSEPFDMYEAHFGLTEKPFSLTPNPRFLYLSRTHQEALAHLRYGLENRIGFIAVTGEVGTGKTTILRQLFDSLDENKYRLAIIFNPCLTPSGLMLAILKEFGLPTRKRSLEGLSNLFNDFLIDENRSGRIPVLVIDEAQNLDTVVLEQIRLLSNFETKSEKLIQIVLVGQPELDDLLGRQDLRQLAQRIAVRCHLNSLDYQETCGYIRHRLKIAGVFGDLFDAKAMTTVFRWSRGVPRLINVLCDRALLCAYAGSQTRVSTVEVRLAAAELEYTEEQPTWLRKVFLSLRRVFAKEKILWLVVATTVVQIIVLVWLVTVLK